MEVLLEIKDVHTYYGNIHALRGINLEVRKGEIVSLIGSNGAGKSTTLMSISGIYPPRRGKITFAGRDITKSSSDRIVKVGISQVPEGRRVFPQLSVVENLKLGTVVRENKKDIKSDVEWVFGLFPVLKERRRQLGGTLSGGEQQMLAIARGLMSRPKLLLLDEPSLGLAPVLVEKIFNIIREIRIQGTTVLLVEQNALMALEISDRGYVLETGRIVLADEAKALLKNDMVRAAYLGE